MAENIDLNINIGANVTDLQAQLQKSENLLKQFEAALKKATNVGEINYLNNQIKNINGTIASLNTQMNKVGRPAADATNALGNLSRVAQDAPYGFIGIANNLNPLLESFQRLQKESGSAGGALKAMAAGLTGPAGIGIALGVVSSLVVAFGDDIAAFVKKAISGTDSIKEHADALKAGQKAYMEAYTEMYNLGNAFDDFHNGLISKKELLKKYNDTLGDTYGKTNDVTEAEKVWEANSDNFIKAAVLRAAALNQVDKAAKKAAEAFEAQAKPKEQYTSAFAFVGAGAGGATPMNLQAQTDKDRLANQKKVVDGLKEEESFHLKVAKTIEDELKALEAKSLYTKFIGKELPKETKERKTHVDYGKELVKEMRIVENASKAFMDNMKKIGLQPLKLFNLPSETRAEEDKRKGYFEKQAKDLLEESKKGGFGTYMEGLFKKDKNKLDEEEGEKKRIEALTQSYYQFAQTISGTVTNALFDMYDAIQKGENPLEVIGQMFANIAKQIAAVIIQALILQALMEAFPALKGAFAAVGLISDATGKGRALNAVGNAVQPSSSFNANGMTGNSVSSNGQFVLKGNDLVLALQRSNSTLNLIR